jgi:hypothetical protein
MEAAEEELRLRRHEVAPTPLVPASPETRASPHRDRNFACYGSGTSGHAAAPVGAGDESAATCSGCGVSLMNATAPYADPHPSNDDLGPDGPTVIFVPVPWGPTAPFPFQPFTLQSEGAVPLPETIDPPPFPHGPFAVPSPPNHSRPSRESRKTRRTSRHPPRRGRSEERSDSEDDSSTFTLASSGDERRQGRSRGRSRRRRRGGRSRDHSRGSHSDSSPSCIQSSGSSSSSSRGPSRKERHARSATAPRNRVPVTERSKSQRRKDSHDHSKAPASGGVPPTQGLNSAGTAGIGQQGEGSEAHNRFVEEMRERLLREVRETIAAEAASLPLPTPPPPPPPPQSGGDTAVPVTIAVQPVQAGPPQPDPPAKSSSPDAEDPEEQALARDFVGDLDGDLALYCLSELAADNERDCAAVYGFVWGEGKRPPWKERKRAFLALADEEPIRKGFAPSAKGSAVLDVAAHARAGGLLPADGPLNRQYVQRTRRWTRDGLAEQLGGDPTTATMWLVLLDHLHGVLEALPAAPREATVKAFAAALTANWQAADHKKYDIEAVEEFLRTLAATKSAKLPVVRSPSEIRKAAKATKERPAKSESDADSAPSKGSRNTAKEDDSASSSRPTPGLGQNALGFLKPKPKVGGARRAGGMMARLQALSAADEFD